MPIDVKTSTTHHLTLKGKAYSIRGSQEGVALSRAEMDELPYDLREMRSVRINSLDELHELEVLLAEVKAHFSKHGRGVTDLRCPYPGRVAKL